MSIATKDVIVYYITPRNSYEELFDRVRFALVGHDYDRLTFGNGHWYGVTPNCKKQVAWFDRPETSNIGVTNFSYLIDPAFHVLRTISGNHVNRYSVIYITSQIPIDDLFCETDLLILSRALKNITFFEL